MTSNRRIGLYLIGMLNLAAAGGCAELVADGHISDRESSAPIPAVEIQQSAGGESWHKLGETDGRGYFWILKSQVTAGATIKFRKAGYYPLTMRDNEFLASKSHLMTPTGEAPEGAVEEEARRAAQDQN